MKNFLSTLKGKIIAGAVTLAIIAAAIVIIVSLNTGYRTICVDDLTGVTTVTARETVSEAFKGQNLQDGNAVAVGENADLTLALDTDKHVYAKELTKFRLEASGAAGKDSRTVIKLEEGSVLNRIDKKLHEKESYTVESPNALMAVRGTTFTVTVFYDEDGVCHTVVEVEEGTVEVTEKNENGDLTDEVLVIGADESIEITGGELLAENEFETPGTSGVLPSGGMLELKAVDPWDFPVPAYGATRDEVLEMYGREYLEQFADSDDTYYGNCPISNGVANIWVDFYEDGTFKEGHYYFKNTWSDYNQLVDLLTEALGEPNNDEVHNTDTPVYTKSWVIHHEGSYSCSIHAQWYTEYEKTHPILVQIYYFIDDVYRPE